MVNKQVRIYVNIRKGGLNGKKKYPVKEEHKVCISR
jgi:hypothetical protein